MSATNIPKVTVFMPVYNGEKYLREAIDSVLAQSFEDFELLIVDDGSTDRTVGIVSSYKDPRIRVLKNDINSGLCVTRNRGLTAARGKYIAMLDCDDIACPGRLAEQISFFENAPEKFALVGSSIELITEDGRTSGVSLFRLKPDEIPAALLFNNCFAQSAIMGKTALLREEKYSEDVLFSEDYDLWVRIAENYKVCNLPKVLTRYRLHPKSTGHTNRDKMIRMIKKIVAAQLKVLHVDFSERDLDIHFSIGMVEYGLTRGYVEEAELWLLKLLRANSISHVYPPDILLKIIRRHWFRLCASNIALGPWIIAKAFASELGGLLPGIKTLLYFSREYTLLILCRNRFIRDMLGFA